MEEEENIFIIHSFDNKIGYGTYADVYRVYDGEKGKTYAYKVFRDNPKRNIKAYETLGKELQIIKRIKHPLIVPFIFGGKVVQEMEEKYVIVTDFYENGTLDDILKLDAEKQSQIGWNDTKKLNFIYLLSIAMSFLHKQNVVHRDLKPSNILVDEYLHPIMSDFGISKIKDGSIITYTETRGSPFYVSPEIILGENYTEEVDVYAFGIILYQIITNNYSPYPQVINMYNFFKCVIEKNKRPKIPPTVPLAYKNLMEDCWNSDPKKRPSFDQIIIQLETNGEFITPNIDRRDFEICMKYAKQFKSNYDTTKPIEKVEKFIDHETVNFKTVVVNVRQRSPDEVIFLYNQAMHLEQKEDDENLRKAADFYKIAAENGHTESMFKYGHMLLKGIGTTTINKEEASKFLKPAAEKGHAEAMLHYSHLLSDQESGLEIDIEKSNEYLKLSAYKDNVEALHEYATKLYRGDYFPIDKEKAESCFKKAADQGKIESMFSYAQILETENKEEEAAKYYKLAADKGHIKSILRFYNMLRNGEGIQRNLKQANFYLDKVKLNEKKKEWFIFDTLEDFTFPNKNKIKERTHMIKGKVNSTGQDVVAKLASGQKVPKLRNELKNLINCCHPLIQKVVGFYLPEDESVATLITYFHQNFSLDDHIEKLKIPDNSSEKVDDEEEDSENDDDFELNDEKNSIYFNHYKIIVGLCSSLKYLEEKGMFHGNLDPSNILLDKDFNPILNNISNQQEKNEEKYYANEILSNENITIKSDVFSFALIVNEIFSGIVPSFSEGKIEISQKVPKFLSSILSKCLSTNPDERPKFSEIFSQLKQSFDSNADIKSFIHNIDEKMKSQITFFRAPKMIVHSPIQNKNKNNKNSDELKCIDIQNLDELLSNVSYNRNVKFIMLCGKFQSGKSTFLREITGNGGFLVGDNMGPTTNGILIDGPYSWKEITERIGSSQIRKDFTEGKIQLENDPAIFFIDSQGVGDQSIQENSSILKKYLSFFCTLSDICINICEMTEHFDVLNETIDIIQTNQISNENENNNDNDSLDLSKEITKIILLVKKYPELPKNLKNKRQLREIQSKFEEIWFGAHKDLENLFLKNLLKLLPIGNPETSLYSYSFTVWNTIQYIAQFLNNSSDHTKDYIQEKIEEAPKFIFSE